VAEIHFSSKEALKACAASEGGKETLAHAVRISTGSAPIFLIAELVQIPAGGASIKQLLSERVVNNPVLIQQIEIPLTFHVHAPHRLLAYY
jgi:hypothetical protein